MVACAVVVVVSDRRQVSDWYAQPAVLLAIINSFLNIVFSAALTLGIAIIWWRSCYHGAKLATLHHIWKHGDTLNPFHALGGEMNAKKAFIISTIVAGAKFVISPLLQRSTHVALEEFVTNNTMVFEIAARLPEGYLGAVSNATAQVFVGGPNGLAAAQGWWSNSTMRTTNEPGHSCNRTCSGTVAGAGVSVVCEPPSAIPLDILASVSESAASGDSSQYPVIFALNSTLLDDDDGERALLVTTLHSSSLNESCIATLTKNICKFKAAVVNYPIVITGDVITLQQEKLEAVTVESIFTSDGDLSSASRGTGIGPLAGISTFLTNNYMLSETYLKPSSADGHPVFDASGWVTDMHYVADPSQYPSPQIYAKCRMMWRSPKKYVIDSIYDFMFRAAIAAGNNTNQVFVAERKSQMLVFRSNYRYLGAALGGTVAALLGILILFWGWWEPGWHGSLSPLEVARAFQAPVMRQAGQDDEIDDVLKRSGQLRVIFKPGVGGERGGIVLQQDLESKTCEEPSKLPQPVKSSTEIGVMYIDN
jgi:hypothetical protein